MTTTSWPGQRSLAPARHLDGSNVSAQRTATWAATLFLLAVLLQRFAVPGTPVPLLVPVVLGWCALGVARGLAVVDRHRLCLWLAAFGTTGLVMPFQDRFVAGSSISLSSWAMFMVVWVPAVLRLVDRRPMTYRLVLTKVTTTCLWLAFGCLVMMGTQVAGIPYQDWFGRAVPGAFQLVDYVITYPISYGSGLYRANAWIGLEPSFVSLQLGLGVLAALYTRAASWRVAVLLGGLGCTFAGSGMAIVAVGLVVMLAHPMRRTLVRHLPMALLALVAVTMLGTGVYLLERIAEFRSDESSTSLRAILPYKLLWPSWVADTWTALLGLGPGSSQDFVTQTNVLGLLVATPIKVFFDYGLLAGSVLAVFLLACYVGGPGRAFSVTMLVSWWLLQPGTTTMLLIVPLVVLVTWWSPRPGNALESRDP